MTRTYYVMPTTELPKVNIEQTCFKTVRQCPTSLDNSQLIIKWDGDRPTFVNTIEGGVEYTHTDILNLLNSEGWKQATESVEQ
mgnify:CR=1 FL=1|tara:strand:- start:9944 stop:10192 length:249 start_codon:yes stop_codon:yes gene_type:complete